MFSLMARLFTPPPHLLMAWLLREELFFAASLSEELLLKNQAFFPFCFSCKTLQQI